MAKAEVSGAIVKNAGRFEGRAAPKGVAPLGRPSLHLTLHQMQAFERFRAELPWLKESHRVLVELASMLRGNLVDPDTSVAGFCDLKAMQELRRCLGQLGATPADESRVMTGDGGDEDPDEGFFGRPH